MAERFGTPAYVYSAATIRNNFRRLDKALDSLDHLICYAVKANSSLAVFVSVKSAPVPNVYIVSATNVTVVANRRLSLQAVGTQSVSTGACNRPADAIKYQWDVTSVSAIPGATVDGYTPAPLSSLTAYVTRDPTTVLLPLLQVRALLTWAA